MAWGLNVNGFSGLSAVSTGPMGTGSTFAAPATAAPGGVAQGTPSFGTTCAWCSSSAGKQTLFIAAIVLLLISWHFHIYSLLE